MHFLIPLHASGPFEMLHIGPFNVKLKCTMSSIFAEKVSTRLANLPLDAEEQWVRKQIGMSLHEGACLCSFCGRCFV